jgi:hypothetical protein
MEFGLQTNNDKVTKAICLHAQIYLHLIGVISFQKSAHTKFCKG